MKYNNNLYSGHRIFLGGLKRLLNSENITDYLYKCNTKKQILNHHTNISD